MKHDHCVVCGCNTQTHPLRGRLIQMPLGPTPAEYLEDPSLLPGIPAPHAQTQIQTTPSTQTHIYEQTDAERYAKAVCGITLCQTCTQWVIRNRALPWGRAKHITRRHEERRQETAYIMLQIHQFLLNNAKHLSSLGQRNRNPHTPVYDAIKDHLNDSKVTTLRGGTWYVSAVLRFMDDHDLKLEPYLANKPNEAQAHFDALMQRLFNQRSLKLKTPRPDGTTAFDRRHFPLENLPTISQEDKSETQEDD